MVILIESLEGKDLWKTERIRAFVESSKFMRKTVVCELARRPDCRASWDPELGTAGLSKLRHYTLPYIGCSKGSTRTMQRDFLSNRIQFVSFSILGTFLMHRIRNVLTKRVLKNPLGDQGTWLPVRPAVIPLSGDSIGLVR